MATKAEYDTYMKAATAMVNAFQAMSGESGGGGGSSVAPAQIQSGMGAAYYQNLYRKYESLAVYPISLRAFHGMAEPL